MTTCRPHRIPEEKRQLRELKGVDNVLERLTKARKEREYVGLARKLGVTIAKAQAISEAGQKVQCASNKSLKNYSKKTKSPESAKILSTKGNLKAEKQSIELG